MIQVLPTQEIHRARLDTIMTQKRITQFRSKGLQKVKCVPGLGPREFQNSILKLAKCQARVLQHLIR